MDTTPIVEVIFTLIDIFTLLPFPFVARLADAFVGFWCVLTNCIDVTVIRSFCALVNICAPAASRQPAGPGESEKQTAAPRKANSAHDNDAIPGPCLR